MSHYQVRGSIKSMSDLQNIFPDGKADELNWCFLSTSGVHGTYTTLDDVTKFFDGEADSDNGVTVTVVHPRMCCIRYGHIDIQRGDIPWLRELVASTLVGVAASQAGNLPAT